MEKRAQQLVLCELDVLLVCEKHSFHTALWENTVLCTPHFVFLPTVLIPTQACMTIIEIQLRTTSFADSVVGLKKNISIKKDGNVRKFNKFTSCSSP